MTNLVTNSHWTRTNLIAKLKAVFSDTFVDYFQKLATDAISVLKLKETTLNKNHSFVLLQLTLFSSLNSAFLQFLSLEEIFK